ncbi:MAG: endonuclease NucS [Bacteroidales bacterium]|nr:endonuclease NucS [Bacteroidales bacterium]MDY6347659.1 endonuclease NucS [Bacteroidales bacterium]
MEKVVIKREEKRSTKCHYLKSYEIERGLLYFGKDVSDMAVEVDVYCSDGSLYENVKHDNNFLYIQKKFFEDRPWLKEGDFLNYEIQDRCNIEIELMFDIEEATKECDLRIEFVSEVRDFLASHINALGNDLQLYKGIQGKEFPADDAGRIDLLCVDTSGNFVVVELKKNMPSDKVVGQISRYMGWVKKNLADGKEVRGIIVAPQSETENTKLNYAVSANPGIQLKFYKISLEIL